jgi:hypothetical protein
VFFGKVNSIVLFSSSGPFSFPCSIRNGTPDLVLPVWFAQNEACLNLSAASVCIARSCSCPTAETGGIKSIVANRSVAKPAKPKVSGAGCANPRTGTCFVGRRTWSGCASGAPKIPVTGNALPRPKLRYKKSSRRKQLTTRSLQKRLLPHRYKMSSRRKTLCCWDLSPIWWTHRYKRSWSKPPGACY